MKITFHNPFIADLKKIIFFWLFLRKNISTKWRSGHRPIVDYFSWKKPPTFCRMNMIFLVENKTNRGEEQNARWKFSFFFLFWIHKKTFHTKTHFGSKNTASTRSGWCKHFLSQNGFLCEMFFFVCSKQKEKWEFPSGVLFLTYFFFVFHQKKLYSWDRRSGAFFMKNSQQMDDVPIFTSSIYFSWGKIRKK